MQAGQPVLRFIRNIAAAESLSNLPDRELLQQFLSQRDEAAFRTLLGRYGPSILGLCRRLLHNEHDAEDVFQATFLILSRKAGSLRQQDALPSWLYGVAYRLSRKANATAARRRVLTRQAVHSSPSGPLDELTVREAQAILDEELARLPAKYQAPLVLCCLQGLARDEAAKQLGWSVDLVKSRLCRARELLRGRLTARGISLPAALIATLLGGLAATAAVPLALTNSTVNAAITIAAGTTATGIVSAKVVALSEGVLKAMALTKIACATVVLSVTGILTVGIGTFAHHYGVASQAEASQAPATKAIRPAPSQRTEKNPDRPEGKWTVVALTQSGKAAPEDEVRLVNMLLDFQQGGKLTMSMPGKSKSGSFKADPSKNPKQIDLELEGEAKRAFGIYRIEKDLLTLCIDDQGKERPTKFESTADSHYVLLVLKRGEIKVDPAQQKEAVAKIQLAAQRAQSSNNLKQIAIAMHNYHDTHNQLPAAAICDKNGKPLLSWRVAILPYLEQNGLYQEFKLDEPWDSAHNKKLLEKMPPIYAPLGDKIKQPHSTFYQVFTGAGTLFEGDKGLRFADITDGMSNTLLIVEAGDAVPWTKPQDLPYEANKKLPPLGGLFKEGFHIGLADGSVHWIRRTFDIDTFRLVITRGDGQVVDWEKLER
jgi:RNA polymerase sigma factor (sigma-70 family)